MAHNQRITASDLLLQRQIASDDNRGNEGGIYDRGAQWPEAECVLNLSLEKIQHRIYTPDDNRGNKSTIYDTWLICSQTLLAVFAGW